MGSRDRHSVSVQRGACSLCRCTNWWKTRDDGGRDEKRAGWPLDNHLRARFRTFFGEELSLTFFCQRECEFTPEWLKGKTHKLSLMYLIDRKNLFFVCVLDSWPQISIWNWCLFHRPFTVLKVLQSKCEISLSRSFYWIFDLPTHKSLHKVKTVVSFLRFTLSTVDKIVQLN